MDSNQKAKVLLDSKVIHNNNESMFADVQLGARCKNGTISFFEKANLNNNLGDHN
jgi:hypothetical protein